VDTAHVSVDAIGRRLFADRSWSRSTEREPKRFHGEPRAGHL
jgi:hypothetical protein